MKKNIFLFFALLFITFSCDNDPTKLKIRKLENPCDIVKAYSNNYKAQIKLYEKNEDEDFDDWEKEDEKRLKKLQRFIWKINNRKKEMVFEDYDGDYGDFDDDMEDCEKYDDMEDLEEELIDFEEEAYESFEEYNDYDYYDGY